MAIPIGSANILIKPSFDGFNKNVSAQLRGTFSTEGLKAGKTFGKSVSEGFSSITPDVVKEAQALSAKVAKLKDAQSASSAKYKKAVEEEEKAQKALAVATLKMNEARENSKTKASTLLATEQKLEAAQKKAADTTKISTDAKKDLDRANDSLTKGEKELQESTDKANKALKDTKVSADKANKSLRDTEGSSKRGAKGLKGLESQAEKTQKATDKLGGFLKGTFAGAIAAVSFTAITAGMKDVIKLAGDLEQSKGAIEAVFKAGSGAMQANSQKSAVEVGLSKNEYNELGTLLGSQLKNGGTSVDQLADKTHGLIKVGADLSSMFGGSAREAVEALSSALKGERDPIERYGVSLNQAKIDAEATALGFKKVGGSWSDQANQAATLSLIMKQTADAQGNFSRETDTYAHKQQVAAAQMDNLKTKFGEVLLPAATSMMGFVSDAVIPAVDKTVEGFKKIYDGFTALKDLIIGGEFTSKFREIFGVEEDAPIVGFLLDVNKILKEVFSRVSTWWEDNREALGKAIAGILSVVGAFAAWKTILIIVGLVRGALAGLWAMMLANPVTLVIGTIALLVGGFIYAYEKVDWFRDAVDKAWAGIQEAVRVAWEEHIRPALEEFGRFFNEKLIPAVKGFWENTLRPAFQAIGDFVVMIWTTYLKPTFDEFGRLISTGLAPQISDLWTKTIQPAFTAIGEWVASVWENFLKPALSGLWLFIRDILAPIIVWLWQNVVVPVFGFIYSVISTVIKAVIVIFTGIVWVINNILAPVFTCLYNNII
jgi:hypothetical protein